MASDPRVAAAISHWAPRFVANGVALSDFEDVTGSHQILGRLVRRLVGARRRARGDGPRGARRQEIHQCRRASAARRRLLPFRQVPVRAGPPADEGRAHEGDRVPQPCAAASQSAGRARRDAVRGQMARRHPAQARRRRAAAGAGLRLRPRFLQGGDRRLRAAVSRARHRDAGVRRPGPGRGRIRLRHPRRLRGRRRRRCSTTSRRAAISMRRASASRASASAATTRRAPPRSTSASRPASRSAAPTTGPSAGTALPDLTREAFRVRSKSATLRGSAPQGRDADAQGRRRATSPARSTS